MLNTLRLSKSNLGALKNHLIKAPCASFGAASPNCHANTKKTQLEVDKWSLVKTQFLDERRKIPSNQNV